MGTLLQRLEFGASHVYSPRGKTQGSRRSQQEVRELKRGDVRAIALLAGQIQSLVTDAEFLDYFGRDTTLVPIPGSAPLVAGGLWVPMIIAQKLKGVGLAREVAPILLRERHVAKSAFVPAAERPNVQAHRESMRVVMVKPAPSKIVLIDDVVTQGCTLLAAAQLVAMNYPRSEIRAFAVFRTMSGIELDWHREPCEGTIEPRGERAMRRP
jgi:predicted amidophosphoribosyltransferase